MKETIQQKKQFTDSKMSQKHARVTFKNSGPGNFI